VARFEPTTPKLSKINFNSSNPTPNLTDAVNVAWTPLGPNENKVYRIGAKLKVEEDYKKDVLR
jgi:hypothetical protein